MWHLPLSPPNTPSPLPNLQYLLPEITASLCLLVGLALGLFMPHPSDYGPHIGVENLPLLTIICKGEHWLASRFPP